MAQEEVAAVEEVAVVAVERWAVEAVGSAACHPEEPRELVAWAGPPEA